MLVIEVVRWYLSTEQALTFLMDNICKNVDNGKLTEAMLIKLPKTFNTLWHPKLIAKVKLHALGDIAVEWLPTIVLKNSNS